VDRETVSRVARRALGSRRARDPRALAAFLAERKREYERQLAAWMREKPGPAGAGQREAAIATWRARIERIEAARAEAPKR
jgi:hypothetical protein